MKKILICSYYYYPENVPRAFRTYELVMEFLKRGYQVDLFIPKYTNVTNNSNASNCKNLKIYNFMTRDDIYGNESLKSKLKSNKFFNLINKARIYFFYTQQNYDQKLKKCLLDNVKYKNYDLCISIGLPILIHKGVSEFFKESSNVILCKIADYGDPFYFDAERKLAPWFFYYEKSILKNFDYVTVPVKEAREAFIKFKNVDYIKVIPQGFDFTNIKIENNYQKHNIPVFGYAGAFYEKVRNPKLFFLYLQKIKMNFKFILYISPESYNLVKKYLIGLENKIIIKKILPRDEVIYELSKLDFLVNFENESNTQKPSKIVDYTLTRRPIVNINCNSENYDTFNKFLLGDYSNYKKANIERFDIRNVVNDFIKLSITKKEKT